MRRECTMSFRRIEKETSCIDLFCGAGGLTHGFIQEGIRIDAGIDLDPECRYPYEKNNGARFIEGNLVEMESEQVEALFSADAIRILAGCAPCQPFSSYSQRYDNWDDEKWSLLYEFGRLVRDIRPHIVTMENVPAIVKYRVFEDFVSTLEELRYHVWYRVVECVHYGVPQTRKRLVLLASLHGPLGLIGPTHRKPRTVRQVIGRMRPIAAGEAAPRDRMHVASALSARNLERIRASRPGGTWRDWPRHLIAHCHRSDSGRTYPGVYGRMEWDKPSPTITTQCYGYGNGRFGHPEQDRAISLREAALLQGFPRRYEFVPPGEPIRFTSIGRMIGNAVPIGLARAIAKSVVEHIQGMTGSTRTVGNHDESSSVRRVCHDMA